MVQDALNKMDISPKLLVNAVSHTLLKKLVPYINGSPGVGKSDIVKQIADMFDLELIDVRLSQMDSTDIQGFPTVDAVSGKTVFVPPEVFPLETDKIPEGKQGWLIFLDELPSASLSTQAASYKLILDRKVGQYKLHSRVAIVAAGNKATDKAIVNRMGTAMQTRLVHYNLSVNHTDWLLWAYANKIDPRVTSFIEFRPELLHRFDPNHQDNTFACPRTWEFTSRLIDGEATIGEDLLPTIAGTVGEGAAREFKGFTNIYENLPKFSELINNTNTAIPTAPDVLYALTGLIAFNVNKQNVGKVVPYVNKLPLEFQIITWTAAVRRNKDVINFPEIKEWIKLNAKDVVL